VRQRLTELGLSFVAHQVQVEPEGRQELERATDTPRFSSWSPAARSSPASKRSSLDLNRHFAEPLDAEQRCAKAAQAKRKEWSKHASN